MGPVYGPLRSLHRDLNCGPRDRNWSTIASTLELDTEASSGIIDPNPYSLGPASIGLLVSTFYLWDLLYCTIPYYTILYYTIPYHTIPYHTIPYHTIPYHTIPYHTIPYHTIPYHTIPYHTIPYHTIPYHTIPYHTVLILYHSIL